jgi:hypothetical protein
MLTDPCIEPERRDGACVPRRGARRRAAWTRSERLDILLDPGSLER